MKKLQGITGLSAIALLLLSCTSNSNVSNAPTAKPAAKPASVASNPSIPSPALKVAPPPGLIQSANPATIPISKGRVDPFSSVPVSPIKQSVSAETNQSTKTQPTKNQDSKTQSTQNQSSKSQSTKNQDSKTQLTKNQDFKTQLTQNQGSKTQLTQNQGSKIQSNQNQSSKTQLTKNQDSKTQKSDGATESSSAGQTIIPDPLLKPAPSTDLARAVQVNGVMQVEGKLSAIVKEPNDTIDRSVSEGDYLSKGAVLVKRIQFNNNEEPLVVLEQNGIEVIKAVSNTIVPVAKVR